MFLLRPKFVIPLAVVSGLAASYGVYRSFKQQEERLQKPEIGIRPVVVASVDLVVGTTLGVDQLQVRQWPEDLVPEGSFQEVKGLEGRVIQTNVTAGEAILVSKLAAEGSAGGVPSLIPPGMRAMTVAVNVVSGVGGFILPNTRVDVLVTVSASTQKEQTTTKMVLQNVTVLAVDQTYKKEDDDPVTVKSVTLLVSPEEAEKLALASNEGKLQLTLRSTADSDLHKSAGIRLGQLINGQEVKPREAPRPRVKRPEPAPPPPPAPAPKVEEPSSTRVIEVIRATQRSELTFEEKEKKSNKNNKPPDP